MQVDVGKKLFSAEEFFRMAEAGILGPSERVELIRGEILQMSPIGPPHAAIVNRMNETLVTIFKGQAIVSVQNSMQVSDDSVPQPDLVLLKRRDDYYSGKRIASEGALLAIEVSDSTLRFDEKVKAPLYAAAGIPEVWIADVKKSVLIVLRDPSDEGFATRSVLDRNDSVVPLAFPGIRINVAELLG